MTGNSSVNLPQSLLIKNYKHNSQLPAGRDNTSCITPPAPSSTNQYHHLYQIGLQYHPLAMCPTTNCPFIDRTIQAHVCERITRTKFHMKEEGVLSRIDKTSLAELNCSINGSSLPGDIFLDKSGRYSFAMEFFLGREVSGIPILASMTHDTFSYTAHLMLYRFRCCYSGYETVHTRRFEYSSYEILSECDKQLNIRSKLNSFNSSYCTHDYHSKLWKVFLEELQHHSMQFESGVISISVDISLYVR